MTTQIEKAYQAALLADAAYITFDEPDYLEGDLQWQNAGTSTGMLDAAFVGTSNDKDIPFGEVEGGRGWTRPQFDEFAMLYRVAYHQPDQDNGFSATLFYDTQEQKHIVAFRGTNDIPYPDLAPTDLLLALGISSSVGDGQHSSIADFFQAAGLVDSSGAVIAEHVGKVDFVGHSLGGYLSLWALYEFRDLFAEVYTYNGAGISALPFSPDYRYIQELVDANPLSAQQQSRIHNFFAEEGPELTANDVTFFRPGQREGLFVERQDALGTVGFHSVSLLVQSLAVYRLFSLIDDQVEFDAVKNLLYATSNESGATLDSAMTALSQLLGEGYDYATAGAAEPLYQQLKQMLGEQSSLGGTLENLAGRSVEELEAAARPDSMHGRGYRHALAHALPFALVSAQQTTAVADDRYDAGNFTARYLGDRALFLSTLLRMNSQDQLHGDLLHHMHFTDLQQGLGFNSDAISYGDGTISDLRLRLVFGSDGADIDSIAASSQDDRLYGEGGADRIDGLAGSDYIEGGAGADVLFGSEGGDILLGGAGDDELRGGAGADILRGGQGADTYYWATGGGADLIGDYDDGGDRIVVNGLDLAALEFSRLSAGSPWYVDGSGAGISLHYDGGGLHILPGGAGQNGAITVDQYSAQSGANFGIALAGYSPTPAPVTDITVSRLGPAGDEVDPSAYWRQQAAQGGLDWSGITISFSALQVGNYTAGTLHGTVGGAFEGGPLGDQLGGDGGANALHGLGGDDALAGGAGDDFLEGGAGSDRLAGGDGSDILFGSARAGYAAELDAVSQLGRFYLAQATDAYGTVNVIEAGAGDDFVSGGEHTDYIAGGPGSNYLLAGTGNDFITGGDDRDIIYGDSALAYSYQELTPGVAGERLEIAFAAGDDSVAVYDDVLMAGGGDDTVWGELGADEIHGQAGDDNLIGDRYLDPVYFAAELPPHGSTSPELGPALHGDDSLHGGPGRDLLLGLGGDDLLAGGPDVDSLLGGFGNDSYYFRPGDGLDFIEDAAGEHILWFTGIAPADLQVLFQGEQVLVGTGFGSEGLYLAKDQWPKIRIALESRDGFIDRARVDHHYYDRAGNLLISVPGTQVMPESARDGLLRVDASDPDHPRISVGEGVDAVAVEALAGEGGAVMRIVSGVLQLSVELAAAQIASGLDFLSLVDGPTMSLIGFSGDIVGTSGADRIIGSDQADTLRGGGGDDVLEGRGGDDNLDGGRDRDYLSGQGGDDTLAGGTGPDTYLFAAGDGQDIVNDTSGYHYFEFGAGVVPEAVTLYYTGTADTDFRIEYSASDAVRSGGATRAYWINGLTVGGVDVPLRQRSDLLAGTFHDTRMDDIFEGGAGSDTFHASGAGHDVFRFAAGDGDDTIRPEEAYYPTRMGTISLAAGVDLESLSFTFVNGDAVIGHDGGDRITLDTATVLTELDNTLSRFTLVSEADPGWIPTIRAQGYVGRLHGSYGSDHIIGNEHSQTFLPGYGDDIIEAGAGADTIELTDLYLGDDPGGIGRKHIIGGLDNDLTRAPLHQALSFIYQPGDGDDTIEYDWSFSETHPYQLLLDHDTNTVDFQPPGQDTLVFGAGITLADLRFIREGDDLQVSRRAAPGGIHISGFFHAWDAAASPWEGDLGDLAGPDTVGPESLLHPAILQAMPASPIASLRFADGSSHDMATVLAALLEDPGSTGAGPGDDDQPDPVAGLTIRGTRDDDVLIGSAGNDRLLGRAGRDTLTGGGGDDVLKGGRGRDRLSGGEGDDTYLFAAGHGRDVITNGDADPQASDLLRFRNIDHDQLWFSRQNEHLVLDIAGTNDRVKIRKWYAREQHQLDVISTGDRVLHRNQVDQLVNAMAAFDVPRGVGTVISEQARIELEPTLASTWQLAS